MSIDTAALTDALQTLVDTRLDTIDRMLLGRVPRADRLAIVAEVESQIFEQLAARGGGEPTRDDVLAVLGRLDPPEAYLPEGDDTPLPRPHASTASRTPLPRPRGGARAATASGYLGITTLVLALGLPLTWLLAGQLDEISFALAIALIVVADLLVLTGSVASVGLAAVARLRNAWAVVGLVTGIIALLAALADATLLILELGG